MKRDNQNYFVVGLFVISGFLLLFFLLLQITGDQSDADEYYVEFENVTGIKDGVIVTYSGYQIGSVKALVPIRNKQHTKYRLTLGVKTGWQIPTDSTAQIVMPAIISDKQIEITQGIASEVLTPGSMINSAEAVDFMELVDSIAQELNQFIPQSTGNINQLIAKMNHSADQVALILNDENVQYMNNMLKHADQSSKSLADLVQGFSHVNQQLDSILNKTDNMIDENSGDIRYSIIELKKSMDTISGRIESVMYNLDASSQNINEFSRTLRHHPGALLGGQAPADKYDGK